MTGANAGIGRTIKAQAGGVLTSVQPWPSAVTIGDTFTVYPGCDKTQATCSSKFSNLARFRGYPYVPAPETII
ncbi:MAG: phage BR0599 family protein [Betaproteobacteria bacterium]